MIKKHKDFTIFLLYVSDYMELLVFVHTDDCIKKAI